MSIHTPTCVLNLSTGHLKPARCGWTNCYISNTMQVVHMSLETNLQLTCHGAQFQYNPTQVPWLCWCCCRDAHISMCDACVCVHVICNQHCVSKYVVANQQHLFLYWILTKTHCCIWTTHIVNTHDGCTCKFASPWAIMQPYSH